MLPGPRPPLLGLSLGLGVFYFRPGGDAGGDLGTQCSVATSSHDLWTWISSSLKGGHAPCVPRGHGGLGAPQKRFFVNPRVL